MKKICLNLLWIFVSVQPALASKLTFDFQSVNLPYAIRTIAEAAHLSVILSPEVKGAATLHLQNVEAIEALDTLLLAYGLIRTERQGVAFIAPRETVIKLTQEEVKWEEAHDAMQPLLHQAFHLQYARVLEVEKVLQGSDANVISKRGGVRVDARTNTLFVHTTAANLREVTKMVAEMDVPVPQILIEARLASVDHDYEQDLGLHFSAAPTTNARSAGRYSLVVAKLAGENWLDISLAALEKAGHARLISSPSLFTTNQQSASIESGEEIPYQEISESGGTAVVFKKAVLALHVTPQVLPGNQVLLQMQINQDRPSDKIVQGVPTITTRQMQTNVVAKSGETIVLGGIYEVDHELGERGLPFFNKIPLVGVLFNETNVKKTRRELLIFVTPKVMASR